MSFTKADYLNKVGEILFRTAKKDKEAGRIHTGLTVRQIRQQLGNQGSYKGIIWALHTLEKFDIVEPPSHYKLLKNAKGEICRPVVITMTLKAQLVDPTKRHGFSKRGLIRAGKKQTIMISKVCSRI